MEANFLPTFSQKSHPEFQSHVNYCCKLNLDSAISILFYILQNKNSSVVRFQILKATCMKMAAFWDMALCSLVEVNRRFRDECYVHHHSDRPDDTGSTHL
jgi:hypothetical protein